MNKSEMDKLRSSVLHQDEIIYVRYTGKLGNFTKGKIYPATPRFAHKSGLPYPEPKWIACSYYIDDDEGDAYPVADERYGKLRPGFEWIKNY